MANKQNMHSFSCVVLFDDLIKNECYFDYLGSLVIVLDIDGKIRIFNKKAEEWTGYSRDEVLGKKWIANFVPRNLRKAVTDAFLELKKGNVEKIEDYTNPILAKDGHELTIRWSNKLINDSKNEFKGIISTGTDITEMIEKDKEVEATRDYYIDILDDMPNLIWKSGVTSKCDYFNKSWLKFTGRKLEQEIGDGWVEGVHPEDLEGCLKIYKYFFSKRKAFYMEYRLKYNDGSYHWLANYGKPIYDKDNNFLGFIGSCYDIQEKKNLVDVEREHSNKLERLNSLMVGRELKMIELKSRLKKYEED
ncbi:PAS domain S-box protein [bacterium]|nr:PAS domain S-box protein [bacterium]